MLLNTIFNLRFPILMLLLLWANINSGFWNLYEYKTPIQMVHAFRAAMPYLLFPLGLFLYRMRPRIGGKNNPVLWLEGYGWIVLLASLLSRNPEAAFYFGAAYMANLYIPQLFLFKSDEIRSERVLLRLTWLIIAGYTIGITVSIRGNLFHGYGIIGLYKEGVAEMAMIRSSGIARFFGATALLALCRFWRGKGLVRLFWIIPIGFCAYIVWIMQSRGAMIGFALAVVFLFIISRVPKYFYVLLIIAVLAVYISGRDASLFNRLEKQVARNQNKEELTSMTGRTTSYKIALKTIAKNPLIGQGNWADRYSGVGHAHNAYLQALLNGGIIGFVPFVISWLVGWRLLVTLSKLRHRMTDEDQQLFLESGVILMFFTARSIPETTLASFSVASMIMVPLYLYMVVLHERLQATEDLPE